MSKLGYGNVAFAGLPRAASWTWLQSVINATALHRTTDHIMPLPLLVDLHLLRMPQRIHYKLYWFSIACMGPRRDIYKRSFVRSRTLSHDRRLRSASSADLTVPATRRSTVYTGRPHLCRGRSACVEHWLMRSGGAHHPTILNAHWKPTYTSSYF